MEVKKLYEWSKLVGRVNVKKTKEWPAIWEYYINSKKRELERNDVKEVLPHLISEFNYQERREKVNSLEMGVYIRVGDICFIDFGEAYIQEIGYQHFGLILSIFRNKVFVVPMSGNETMCRELLDSDNQLQKPHLMPFNKVKGMNKDTILFINDAKFINSSRIIDVKAYLNPNSKQFKAIKKRVLEVICEGSELEN